MASRSASIGQVTQEAEKEDRRPAEPPDWLGGLGAGAMALLGAGAFILCVIAISLIDMIGGTMPGDAAPVEAEGAAFEAPESYATVPRNRAKAPAWQAHSEPFEVSARTPLIAVVILDDGTESHTAMRAVDWEAPLSFAVSADFDNSPYRVQQVRLAGREALALVPFGYGSDLGRDPNVLRRGLTEAELLRRLRWHLARSGGGIIGIVDRHSGDIVRDAAALRTVGDGLASEGLVMIDSRSDPESLLSARLRPMGVPVGRRTTEVLRDGSVDDAFAALTDAERHAFAWGTAIVLVEAGETSMEALAEWLRSRSDSIAIAPVSHVIRRLRTGLQYAAN